jgi:hypothetical protein
MRKSLKNYIAAFGKWGFFMAAILVGDILGIIQSYYTEWLIPAWGWWLILVIILIVSPFIAFHKLRVQRDELQAQLQKEKNIPKLPHPELYITYDEHEFGIAGEGKYADISIDKGTPVLSIEAEFRPTGPMRIETVELCLAGKRLPSLNWKVQEPSAVAWFSADNIFNISGVSEGEHDVELWALANGEWWRSRSFPLEINLSSI